MTRRTVAGIDDVAADRITEEILGGRTDLRFAGLPRSMLFGLGGLDARAMVKNQIEAFLSGRNPATAARAMRRARDLKGSISLVAARLLAHGGCEPAAWALLCRHVDHVNLPGPMGGMTVVTDDVPGESELVDAHVLLGEGAYWIGAGRLDLTREMPESVVAALPGRPLSDLVSHPVLDAIGLTITACIEQSPGTHVVETDFEAKPEEDRAMPFSRMTRRAVGRTTGS